MKKLIKSFSIFLLIFNPPMLFFGLYNLFSNTWYFSLILFVLIGLNIKFYLYIFKEENLEFKSKLEELNKTHTFIGWADEYKDSRYYKNNETNEVIIF